jgi:hypothetical protein
MLILFFVELDGSSSVSKVLSIDLKELRRNYTFQRSKLVGNGSFDTVSMVFVVLIVIRVVFALGHLTNI